MRNCHSKQTHVSLPCAIDAQNRHLIEVIWLLIELNNDETELLFKTPMYQVIFDALALVVALIVMWSTMSDGKGKVLQLMEGGGPAGP
jgi:hypothetical protein